MIFDDLEALERSAVNVLRGSKDWNLAWSALATKIVMLRLGDGTDLCQSDADGEGWELLGSFREPTRMVHSFRHRCHPKNGIRYSFNLVVQL